MDPIVISLHLELGDVYYTAGSLEAAVQVYEEVRRQIEESEGSHHPDLPAVYLRLVEAMFDFAELERICECCRKGIDSLERWGEDSPLLSRLLYYQARTEMELGRPEQARSLIDKSLRISAPYLDHEGDGSAWFFLASVEQALGNFERALECIETARTNYEQSSLDDDRIRGDLYARLSSIYAGKGDQTKCREFADQAMDAWAREKVMEQKGAEGGRS
jgi:tetratricopeptide (TPR) repeat protein